MASKKTVRVHIALEPSELEAIENFRFENRMQTRAAAIRELIKRGLSASNEQK